MSSQAQHGKKQMRASLYCASCPGSWVYVDNMRHAPRCKHCGSDWCLDGSTAPPPKSKPDKGKGEGKGKGKGKGKDAGGLGKGPGNAPWRSYASVASYSTRQVLLEPGAPGGGGSSAGAAGKPSVDEDPITTFLDSKPRVVGPSRHLLGYALTLGNVPKRLEVLADYPGMQALVLQFDAEQQAKQVAPTHTQLYFAARKDFQTAKKQCDLNTTQVAKHKGIAMSLQTQMEENKAKLAHLEDEKKSLDLIMAEAQQKMDKAYSEQPQGAASSDNASAQQPMPPQAMDEAAIKSQVAGIVNGGAGLTPAQAGDQFMALIAKILASHAPPPQEAPARAPVGPAAPPPLPLAPALAAGAGMEVDEAVAAATAAAAKAQAQNRRRRKDDLTIAEAKAKVLKKDFSDAPGHTLAIVDADDEDLVGMPAVGASSQSSQPTQAGACS
jgi:hypothetical protein